MRGVTASAASSPVMRLNLLAEDSFDSAVVVGIGARTLKVDLVMAEPRRLRLATGWRVLLKPVGLLLPPIPVPLLTSAKLGSSGFADRRVK